MIKKKKDTIKLLATHEKDVIESYLSEEVQRSI